MSATTQILIEQISQLKERIASARRLGQNTAELETQCSELSKKLTAASEALNEGRQILKG